MEEGRGWTGRGVWVWGGQASLAQLVREMEGTRIQCDSGVQTETHPVSCNIDRQHEWNAWAMRKRAIAAANLCSKHTSGAQTTVSHFRKDTPSQVSRCLPSHVLSPVP